MYTSTSSRNPEVGEVDPRLDGEAGSRQDAAGVARLVVVEVDAEAMNRRPRAQAVSGPVREELAVSRLLDAFAGGAVQLPALQDAAPGVRLAQP